MYLYSLRMEDIPHINLMIVYGQPSTTMIMAIYEKLVQLMCMAKFIIAYFVMACLFVHGELVSLPHVGKVQLKWNLY